MLFASIMNPFARSTTSGDSARAVAISLAIGLVVSRFGFSATESIRLEPDSPTASDSGDGPAADPALKAIAYLAREVPDWSVRHSCFSCHNNGDAARALYVAKRSGYAVPASSLRSTTEWLLRPADWDDNGGDGPESDRRLARIQFAAALGSAIAADMAANAAGRSALKFAAERLVAEQDPDGSWLNDSDGILGTPATYGRPLATLMARDALIQAGFARSTPPVAAADRWLRQMKVQNVMEAATVLLAAAGSCDADWEPSTRTALTIVKRGQSADGGWGPFVTAPPEPFDTAIVLLALARNTAVPGREQMVARGRHYLVASQLADGSWPETTRPPGAESYAQRLSTGGWATLALIVTNPAAGTR